MRTLIGALAHARAAVQTVRELLAAAGPLALGRRPGHHFQPRAGLIPELRRLRLTAASTCAARAGRAALPCKCRRASSSSSSGPPPSWPTSAARPGPPPKSARRAARVGDALTDRAVQQKCVGGSRLAERTLISGGRLNFASASASCCSANPLEQLALLAPLERRRLAAALAFPFSPSCRKPPPRIHSLDLHLAWRALAATPWPARLEPRRFGLRRPPAPPPGPPAKHRLRRPPGHPGRPAHSLRSRRLIRLIACGAAPAACFGGVEAVGGCAAGRALRGLRRLEPVAQAGGRLGCPDFRWLRGWRPSGLAERERWLAR